MGSGQYFIDVTFVLARMDKCLSHRCGTFPFHFSGCFIKVSFENRNVLFLILSRDRAGLANLTQSQNIATALLSLSLSLSSLSLFLNQRHFWAYFIFTLPSFLAGNDFASTWGLYFIKITPVGKENFSSL